MMYGLSSAVRSRFKALTNQSYSGLDIRIQKPNKMRNIKIFIFSMLKEMGIFQMIRLIKINVAGNMSWYILFRFLYSLK